MAGQVHASWSQRGRVRSEAAFAKLADIAPLPASSGVTVRHRLSPMEEREVTRALDTIVLVRLRQSPPTKALRRPPLRRRQVRQRSERCLERYGARHPFPQLEGRGPASVNRPGPPGGSIP